eukprot:4785349-Prymnesium_polylepis.1
MQEACGGHVGRLDVRDQLLGVERVAVPPTSSVIAAYRGRVGPRWAAPVPRAVLLVETVDQLHAFAQATPACRAERLRSLGIGAGAPAVLHLPPADHHRAGDGDTSGCDAPVPFDVRGRRAQLDVAVALLVRAAARRLAQRGGAEPTPRAAGGRAAGLPALDVAPAPAVAGP